MSSGHACTAVGSYCAVVRQPTHAQSCSDDPAEELVYSLLPVFLVLMLARGIWAWYLVRTSSVLACAAQVPAYRLKLPPKRLFNHNPTPDFVEERRQQLDSYLQMLLQDRQLQGAPA